MQKPVRPQPVAYAAARPLAAVGLMCITWALFACLDATAKHLGSATDLPMPQIVWMRFLGQFAGMLALLGLVAVPDLMRTRKPAMQIVRSFLLLGSTVFNFLALRHLQLDQATTINFLAPLATAVLAGPLLGEWIGWRRGVAIVVGFCGALVAIRPGFASLNPGVALALGTMLCMAFFGIVTRYLAAFDRSEVTLFYSLMAGTVVVAPFALAEWVWPAGPFAWLLLLSMGVLRRAGPLCLHRRAPLCAGLHPGAVPLHRPSHPLHRRVPGVRPGAGPLDAGRCRHRHRHRPLPRPPRARHRPRRRRIHDDRGRVAALGVRPLRVHNPPSLPRQ